VIENNGRWTPKYLARLTSIFDVSPEIIIGDKLSGNIKNKIAGSREKKLIALIKELAEVVEEKKDIHIHF
jgi:hypothetical protein